MNLNTITWGDGRRTALLLHGITSNAAGWWRLGPAIAELGYTVVAPDLRGHGGSPKSDDHLIPSHSTDVRELADHWDVVIGHSIGGVVATVTAVSDSEWTSRLILEDPAIYLPDLSAVIVWLMADFDAEVTAASLSDLHPDWSHEDALHKAEALSQCGPDVVELLFTQNDPFDYRDAVAALAVPTLVIGAEPGRALIPTEMGQELAANPSVTFAQVMASHSMHRDAWDDFWAVVSPLLAGP